MTSGSDWSAPPAGIRVDAASMWKFSTSGPERHRLRPTHVARGPRWAAQIAAVALTLIALPAVANDAATIATATKLNEQWAAFDKSGKYPDKANPGYHATVLKALSLIPADSPSYRQAQDLKAKFMARQIKITKIEDAKNPAIGVDPQIKLTTVDMSYSSFVGSVTITNPNAFPIADIRISCSVYAGSGSTIKEYNQTIYEIVPAKSKKTIRNHRFGYWPDQGKKVGCSTVGYQKR
jgi:hypothetical protein